MKKGRRGAGRLRGTCHAQGTGGGEVTQRPWDQNEGWRDGGLSTVGAQRPWAGVQSVGWEQVYRLGPPDDPERKIPPAIGISHLPLGSKPLGCPAAVAFHEWVSLGV